MGFCMFIFPSCDIVYYMDENYSSSANIGRQSTDGLKNITHAGLFARFVAFMVDLAIMSFVAFGFVLLTQNTVCKASTYVKKAQDEFYSYQIDSGLYEKSESTGLFKERTFDSYKGYQDMFFSYYTDYLVNKCPEKYRISYDGKDVYWFNVHVLGQPDDLNLYASDLEGLHEIVKVNAASLFTYKLDADNKPLYNEVALPKCVENNPEAEISEENQKKLTRYFYISDVDNTDNSYCYYYIATLDLTSRKFVSNAYDQWYMHYYTLPLVCSFGFSMIIFFFVLPMIFKRGETIGKLIFHLGLANKLGYKHSRLQLIPRTFFLVAVVVVLALVIGINLWFLGIVTFLALASYGLAIFTKDHKAIHDYIAGTIVVDKVHSEIYDNATQEDKVKSEIEAVQSLISDVEVPTDNSVLYVNKNYNKDKDDKEG